MSETVHIGGHLSIAGSFLNPLEKTIEIGGNALQIFSSSPRQWERMHPSPVDIQQFLMRKKELDIDPIYFHASYLVNLADDGWVGKTSVKMLAEELQLAEKMGIKGTIVHLGSFKLPKELSPMDVPEEKYEVLIRNIQAVLTNSSASTLFMIENAGNRKIGVTIEQIAQIIKDVNNPRVRVCLDTCHWHGAGYDLSDQKRFDIFFNKFDREIGLKLLEVFQVNDSKDQLGSYHDRHENINEGFIPKETFRLLLTDERTKNLPFILETPVFDKKGPDAENITRLLAYSRK